MEIEYSKETVTRPASYIITIPLNDNLDPWEILNCFKFQYPTTECIILFGSEKEKGFVGLGVILLSDRIPKLKRTPKVQLR